MKKGRISVMAVSEKKSALRAYDLKTVDIYRCAYKPGWACWPTAWKGADGSIYVSFQELRIGPNKKWEPVPLDFWETVGLPKGYQVTLCGGTKDLVPESVVMKSADGGETWKEIGRDDARAVVTFAWNILPDGRLMRVMNNDYLAWGANAPFRTYSEISADGGNTWTDRTVILEGYATNGGGYRLRVLKDGTLATLVVYSAAWCPGGEQSGRNHKRPGIRQEQTAAFWFSGDMGKSWKGPCCVLPGINAWEPDFCELPSGDLLLVNSSVQAGPIVRQYVRKTDFGWIPGPVFENISGAAPECLAYGADGLIVGALRFGPYLGSVDEGQTWHEISGLPISNYQPFAIPLDDGRFFTAWHGGGGDKPFGEKDLWIGAHIFRVDAGNAPKPTKLSLHREKSEDRSRFVNSFTARLTYGGEPLTRRKIRFILKRNNTGEESDAYIATDGEGAARFDLTGIFENETKIHVSYSVNARFEPESGEDDLRMAESGQYFAYAVTCNINDLGWD